MLNIKVNPTSLSKNCFFYGNLQFDDDHRSTQPAHLNFFRNYSKEINKSKNTTVCFVNLTSFCNLF